MNHNQPRLFAGLYSLWETLHFLDDGELDLFNQALEELLDLWQLAADREACSG